LKPHNIDISVESPTTMNRMAIGDIKICSDDISARIQSIEHIEEPLISVIIPVLQEEKLIANSLQIFTKEFKGKFNLEVIVSDGGSTDRTIEIARQNADFIVEHKEIRRQTIAEGRNCGAKIARGDVLVFINGDTIPDNPDQFFKFIYNWAKNGYDLSAGTALACTVNVAPDERIFKDKIFYGFHNLYVRTLNLIGIGMGRGECQIVRTEDFNRIGGYNPNIAAGEDFDLYRRIAKIGKVRFISQLRVFESPRRFRKYGYLRILGSWTLNSLSVMLFGRSVSDEWEQVR
jgi:glycosyltransferase involved in cell wall biosynthesis